MKTTLRVLPWFFIIAGLIITVIFLISLYNDGYTFSTKNIDIDLTIKTAGFIGGMVGPLISAAGFFFLFLNLREQNDTFHIERLESKFFEMIKFHRANIEEMKFTYFERNSEGNAEKYIAEKRKVFKLIHRQFEDLYNEVNFLFENKDVSDLYEDIYIDKLLQNETITQRTINLKDYAKLDILYLIIFFGVGQDGIKTILQMTNGKYKLGFVNTLLIYTAFKPKKEYSHWQDWLTLNKYSPHLKIEKCKYILEQRSQCESILGVKELKNKSLEDVLIFNPNSFEKYYGGHQFRLGHYFRNFFQAVMCIHEDKKLDHNEKYDYIKVLRAQLSTTEQIIFFLNSISQLGRVWEFEKKSKPEKGLKLESQLITSYNLIKNLPNRELIDGITYLSFYPLVSYEAIYDENVKEQRKLLKKQL